MGLFEQAFAKKFSAVDAVAFPYGRSAQWAFFEALGIKGSEVIMPAYTCSVVAHAVSLSGNMPRFVDIELDDYNMKLDAVEAAINEKTRAIIATHTFGYPQDIDRLERIVEYAEKRFGHKVWLMQDCCHAFGAEWNGRLVGSSGDVAVYALNVSKVITSIFGGMLTFQDPELAQTVRAWRDGRFKDASLIKAIKRRLYLLSAMVAFSDIFYRITWFIQERSNLLNWATRAYHLDELIHFPPDFDENMLDFEAMVGLVQLEKYDEIIQLRRRCSSWYNDLLSSVPTYSLPPLRSGATYSHYVVRVSDREAVKSEWAQRGVELGELIQYSIPHLAAYGAHAEDEFPNAKFASLTTVNFPVTSKRVFGINLKKSP